MKLIKQTSYQDCGVACLAMLINHFYNYQIDLQQIKFYLSIDNDELSFYDLIDLATNFYLKGEAFRVDQDFYELKNKTPFLAQVINEEGMLHFVVVKQIEKDQIVVFDPSKNKKQTTTIKNFLITFNGNVMLFKANLKKFKQSFNFKLTKLKSLVNFSFVCFILLNLISTLLFIIDTQFLKMFFNSLVNEKQQILLYLFPIIVLILSILWKTFSNSVLNQSYKRRKTKLSNDFFSFNWKEKQFCFFNLYQEIIWVLKFENYRLISSIASLVAELVSLVFIYFILKQLFLVILIANLIYIFISFGLNIFIKHDFKNKDKD